MRIIHLVDLIGVHCGMHYYDVAFAEVLRNNGFNVDIMSNYNDNKQQKSFFPMMFGRGKVLSIVLLIYSYWKFLFYLLFHRKEIYIYMAYGELYDLTFLSTSIFSKYFFADVHEVHALKYKTIQKYLSFSTTFTKKFRQNLFTIRYVQRIYFIL